MCMPDFICKEVTYLSEEGAYMCFTMCVCSLVSSERLPYEKVVSKDFDVQAGGQVVLSMLHFANQVDLLSCKLVK